MNKSKINRNNYINLKHNVANIKPTKIKYLTQSVLSYEDELNNVLKIKKYYTGRKSLNKSQQIYVDNFKNAKHKNIKENAGDAPFITKFKMKTSKLGTDISLALLSNQAKPYEEKIFADVPYSLIDDKGNAIDKRQTFNVYMPNDNKFLHPVLFYFHGGAWSSGDKAFYSEFCQKIADSGVVVVNVNYRLLPFCTMSDILQDCTNAILCALKNKRKYKINSHAIFLSGDSAGAHLSALLPNILIKNCKLKQSDIRGLVLFYGAYNLATFYKSNFGIVRTLDEYLRSSVQGNINDFYEQYSPINLLDKNFPHSLIICGKVDKLYDQTEEFIKALDAKHIEYEKLIFPKSQADAIHGFLNISKSPSSKKAIAKTIKFLKSKFK